MATFSTTDEMYRVVTPFLIKVTRDADLAPKFAASHTSFRVNYHDPEGTLLIDATQEPVEVKQGEQAREGAAAVELSMSGDDGHKFWLGDLNMPIALAKRKIKVSGNLTKMLGLLPAMAPAFERYKAYLKEISREDLL